MLIILFIAIKLFLFKNKITRVTHAIQSQIKPVLLVVTQQ